MNTPYSEIYDIFLDLINKDTTFFIRNSDNTINQEFTNERMKKLLNHAIINIKLINDKKDFEIDLDEKDNDNSTLLYEATKIEQYLIANYMFASYIDEEFVVRINELKRIGFSDKEIEITIFSPSQSLKEFNNSVIRLKSENESKVKMYLRRGRLDNKYKFYNWKPLGGE
jgi:hypothetical protein